MGWKDCEALEGELEREEVKGEERCLRLKFWRGCGY